MASFYPLLVVVLVGVTLVHTGESLQCYRCESNLHGDCADVSDKPEFATQCNSGDNLCYTVGVYSLDPPSGKMIRGCGNEDVCNGHHPSLCKTCVTDLCNTDL